MIISASCLQSMLLELEVTGKMPQELWTWAGGGWSPAHFDFPTKLHQKQFHFVLVKVLQTKEAEKSRPRRAGDLVPV